MATEFNSFNQSPLGAFIQSALGVRGQDGNVFVGNIFISANIVVGGIPFNAIRCNVTGAPTTILTPVGQIFNDGDRVQVYPLLESEAILSPLEANTVYYIVNATDTTLELSLTEGGVAISFPSDGGVNLSSAYDKGVVYSDYIVSYDQENDTLGREDGNGEHDLVSTGQSLVRAGDYLYLVSAKAGLPLVLSYDTNIKGFKEIAGAGVNVFGLIDYNGSLLCYGDAFKVYDPILNTWSNTSFFNYQTSRCNYIDGKLYFFDSSAEKITIISGGSVTQSAVLNSQVADVVPHNGNIYAVGSYPSSGVFASPRTTIFKWDGSPGSNPVQLFTDEPGHGAVYDVNAIITSLNVVNNKLYAAGSFDYWQIHQSDVSTDIPVGGIVEITGDYAIDDVAGGLKVNPIADHRIDKIVNHNNQVIALCMGITQLADNSFVNTSNLFLFDGSNWGSVFGLNGSLLSVNDFYDAGVNLNTLFPAISIASPGNNSLHAETYNVNFAATASDFNGIDISSDVEWESDVDGSLGTGPNILVNSLSAGSHLITATITDAKLLEAKKDVSITVQALSITLVNPFSGGAAGGTSVSISGTGFGSNTTVEFGGAVANNIVVQSTESITCDTPAGSGTVNVEVIDGVNSDTLANGFQYTGGGSNAPPVVTITSPADGSSHTAGVPINFTGTAIDDNDGDISSSITWFAFRLSPFSSGVIGTGASINHTLTAGAWQIFATAADSQSASNSDSINITVV